MVVWAVFLFWVFLGVLRAFHPSCGVAYRMPLIGSHRAFYGFGAYLFERVKNTPLNLVRKLLGIVRYFYATCHF